MITISETCSSPDESRKRGRSPSGGVGSLYTCSYESRIGEGHHRVELVHYTHVAIRVEIGEGHHRVELVHYTHVAMRVEIGEGHHRVELVHYTHVAIRVEIGEGHHRVELVHGHMRINTLQVSLCFPLT